MKKITSNETDQKLTEKDDDQEYGIVTKKLGGGKFLVKLNLQTKEIIARLVGKLKTKKAKKDNWVDIDTVVLVGLRDFQDNVADIVYVYSPAEVRQLHKKGELVEAEENLDNVEDTEVNICFDDI